MREAVVGPVAEFCFRLKELHARSGLTQKSLAQRLDRSQAQVSAILNGKITRPPSWELVENVVVACLFPAEGLPAVDQARVLARWRSRHADLEEAFEWRRRQVCPAQQVQSAPDVRLSALGGPSAPGLARLTVPRELPADVAAFTGRARERAEFDRLLGAAGQPGRNGEGTSAVLISAVAGTAGVGKTALAVRWAHQAQDKFPDGQLYVNLRGYDAARPVAAGDALAGFLRALGVPRQDIPAGDDERATWYRSLLAGRRMLVVLDNASDVEQVRPLLPGCPSCVVVVTSRDALAGLVARHGARRLVLDPLPLADSVVLLRALIGSRVDADPEATAALAAQCGRLPLALRVAAELASELADRQRRLDLLEAGGDPRTAVRAVFSWSYRHLAVDAARMFRLLGLHPGTDLDRYAAAALVGTDVEQAVRLLDGLARAHLIQPGRTDRYGLHGLLRAYAAEQALHEDPEPDRQAALTRLFDHYLHSAARAMDILVPATRHRRPRVSLLTTPVPLLADATAARAWLDAERATLVATAGHAATRGWPRYTIRLAITVSRYLDDGGHYPEAVTIYGYALSAAQLTGDHVAEATALTSLGLVCWRQGSYRQAAELHQRALALFREADDRHGEAIALGHLGVICQRQGRYQQAAEHHQRALALFREADDRHGEAIALGHLGAVNELRGCYQQAAELHWRALALFREVGDCCGEAIALKNLGLADLRLGRYQQAADHDQEALALLHECGNRSGEAETLNGLGEILLVTGRPEQARAQYTAALTLAGQIGDKYEEACAHHGLARVCRAVGKLGHTRDHWQRALAFYTQLGAPEASRIRAQLATLQDVSEG